MRRALERRRAPLPDGWARLPGNAKDPVVRPALPIAALLVSLSACATIPTQSKFMQEQGVKVSSEAIRMRLRSEAIPFTGLMAQAADVASAESSEPAVKRRALVWKINVVPAMYRTLFNQRPLIALLDTWALLVQAEQYLESPEGKAAFGPGAEGVLATTRDLEGRLQEIAHWAVPERSIPAIRARVAEWAAKHPVRLTFATRDSIDQYLVTLAPTEELSVFAAVGQLNEDMNGLIGRMDFLPVMVPNQVTWQAQLAYIDLIDPRMDDALKRGGQAMESLDAMIAWLGTSGLEGFAEEQRIQIMGGIAAERVEIERLVERQRGEIQAFVDRERVEIAALLQRERAAVMADAQRFSDHATAEATRSAKEVVDHAILRLAVVLGALLVFAAVLVLALRRRTTPPRSPSG
jgi:hypothetical protein